MPLDGTVIKSVVNEISVLSGGRVDKISQPEKDEILFLVRAKGENHKLLITANSSSPRVCFTSVNKTSPLQAPMFCMVLRKHLLGGRVVGVVQPNFERIAELLIESADEMGDKTTKRLIVEIMGKHSNIILVNSEGKVVEAIKHIPLSVSRLRPILPGVKYESPPGKMNPLEILGDFVSFFNVVKTSKETCQKTIFQNFNGISPILASDICIRASLEPEKYASELADVDMERLHKSFKNVLDAVGQTAYMYFEEVPKVDGISSSKQCDTAPPTASSEKPLDFSAIPLAVFSNHRQKTYDSTSRCLEDFYTSRDVMFRVGQKTADLRKLVSSHLERARKKSFVFEKTKEEIKDRDSLRIFGELITAYLYMVKLGDDKLVCENFHDGYKLVEIKLDRQLSPSENAQRYFKQYNKQKRTHEALLEQINKNREELEYLEGVKSCCEQELTEAEIGEIRAELAEQGYAKKKNISKKPEKPSKPLEIKLDGGFRVYVGKNNTQNDWLTLKFAKHHDIWLHTKDIPGSHIILATEGREVPQEVLLCAAEIAAFYSKARNGSNVPVDYVAKKYVKKPNGAKPGYVIYDFHKTLFVAPNAHERKSSVNP